MYMPHTLDQTSSKNHMFAYMQKDICMYMGIDINVDTDVAISICTMGMHACVPVHMHVHVHVLVHLQQIYMCTNRYEYIYIHI